MLKKALSMAVKLNAWHNVYYIAIAQSSLNLLNKTYVYVVNNLHGLHNKLDTLYARSL